MSIGWVYHDRFKDHLTGSSHPESPQRLEAIASAVHQVGLLSMLEPLAFSPADPSIPAWLHDPEYVQTVRSACQQRLPFLSSPDTAICPDSFDIALLAIGGVLAACDAAMQGGPRKSFCAVRPAGHHAERDLAMGFCLFNNVALAAEHLIRSHHLRRVAIVDFDVHHGNGTQHLFDERSDVLFISLHEHPRYLFPGTGYAEETGVGDGEGFTLNIPMLPGADDVAYRQAFDRLVFPRLLEFDPQFLLLSAGFDAVAQDPMADLNLSPQSYGWITRELVNIADQTSEGRIVSVLEGGYDLPALGESVAHHLRALGARD